MNQQHFTDTAEQRRLDETRGQGIPWNKWGPYLSERQWGTVREDYSDNGDAWNFFTHDHARSRAYRWGEDGIAGISDDHQHLCFALALWNGKDAILKERLFGLTNSEGRHREADEFYQSLTPASLNADQAGVMRQALAGMLWSKQFFFFDGDNWLDEHHSNPLHTGYHNSRNSEWFHMLNEDIISMPDKWEYPWYAAWDLAFHTLALAIVDPDFAKEQMKLMLKGAYLHPNGQMPAYQDMVTKFAEHFFFIAAGINRSGQGGMWDEEDGFYYDLLRLPDGRAIRLKVRSMVGLLPLCATTVIEKDQRERIPGAMDLIIKRLERIPELKQTIHPTGPGHYGTAQRGVLALVNPERLRRILTKMLDENEFLNAFGIRALSKFHQQHPYIFHVNGQEHRVEYLPAESNTGMFGGNSNWRGPIWMPVNVLILRALLNFHLYYGDNFKIECPTGSGNLMNLFEVAREIADRLGRIFLRDGHGRRPVYGGSEKFQNDPHWRDYILFYEYFHGDNGAGLGASHQTGWTGLVAKTMQLFGLLDAKTALDGGRKAAFTPVARESGT